MSPVSPLSAVESKPASDGRIKTSHFFLFKPFGDILARSDFPFYGVMIGT
jgi:hypothetical protein